MTKKELAKAIAEDVGLQRSQVLEIVQMVFDSITEILVRERRLELRNFGIFEVKQRRPRRARNPRTGEPVQVPEKRVVHFQPGREMLKRVSQLNQVKGAVAATPSQA